MLVKCSKVSPVYGTLVCSVSWHTSLDTWLRLIKVWFNLCTNMAWTPYFLVSKRTHYVKAGHSSFMHVNCAVFKICPTSKEGATVFLKLFWVFPWEHLVSYQRDKHALPYDVIAWLLWIDNKFTFIENGKVTHYPLFKQSPNRR